MICVYCKKETDERYIIDMTGVLFCSEDCLEQFMDEQDTSFDPHPYEDTYLMLRNAYIELLDHWKETLKLATEIDELIGEHADFIRAEGDDGSYAWEINQYTIKLKELQKQIFSWRPNRKTFYWITSDSGNYGDLGKAEEIYKKICIDLNITGYEEYIHYVVKHHQHPYHWGLNYVFDDPDMAKEAYEILNPACKKHGVDISLDEAHKCEAHCGDILNTDADTYINGWFYCYSCKESEDHGIFTPQELDIELRYYQENEEERQVVINNRRDWCMPYKKKIKRTCRSLDVE
jgi:hypothetical protein